MTMAALAASVAAMSATGTLTVSANLPYADTNWTNSLVLSQFDNSLFNLDSVDISFHGAIQSTMKFENRNSTARDYSAQVGYNIVLNKPAGGTLLAVNPNSASVSGTLPAYDGTFDFGGTSGISYPTTNSDASGTVTITDPSDLAAFIGTGNVSLPVNASASSTVVGSGNFVRQIMTQAAADVKITYHYSYTPASVGDYVWYDKNNNGIQDAGEKGVGSVKVSLLDKDGNVVSTTTTDSNGLYKFSDLVPGQYQVKFDLPSGTAFTSQGAGATDKDSDAGSGGLTSSFVLHSGEDRTDIDAGLVGLQSLGDRVWADVNKNGLQDDGEKGVGNVTVTLLDGSGNPLGSTTTDGNGIYQFNGLLPDNYKVQFTAPAGTTFTTQTAGADRTVDSDVDTTGLTNVITVNPGDNITTVDAGLIGTQSLGDRVWLDLNANGLQDTNEPGLSNVGVTLLDGSNNVIGTTTTDGNGLYKFEGLFPGNYIVKFDTPAGYEATGQGVGGDRNVDSDADTTGTTGNIVLNVGDNRTDIDAGFTGNLVLGDRVWFDQNANGIQDDGEKGIPNVTVTLLDGSGNVIATDITDSLGNYLFTDLVPGNYRVRFSKPTGYTFSGAHAGSDVSLDSDADGSGLTDVVALTADNLNVDAGLYGTLCVGDRVWRDDNKNGLQDSCEPGVKGVTVSLLDKDGNVLATTVTDANGYYRFTNLAPGDYAISFDAPDGYGFTKQFANAFYKQYDSNADVVTGTTPVFTLVSNDSTIDAGLIAALKIGDTVWLDSDGDGVYEPDAGERGIKGVKVTVYGDTNNDNRIDVSYSTYTDANGHYLFNGLMPGKYQVVVDSTTLPRGVTQTYDLDGLSTKNSAIAPLTNKDNLDFDFGYKPASSPGCGSHKWWSCNPSKWCNDWVWIGGKCHSKSTVCSWMKRDDCGDKSICVYQRLCAAKLNVADGCNSSVRVTCGSASMSVRDAICKLDDWLKKYPVGCKVNSNSSAWKSICDVYGIVDKYCAGQTSCGGR